MTVTAARVASAAELFEDTLRAHVRGGVAELAVVDGSGSRALPVGRWCRDADAVDIRALSRLLTSVSACPAILDLGCGPGRHSGELAGLGVRVLGIDVSATAVALTRERGAQAMRGNALGPVPGPRPGHDRWDAALLLDGNVGIGGDPLLLLCRVRDLLAYDGCVLVELDASGISERRIVRLTGGGRTSTTFPWGRLGVRALNQTACLAGFAVQERWVDGGRVFALLGQIPAGRL